MGPVQLAQARRIAPVVCVQNAYAAGGKPETHEFLRECGALGVAFVPFFAIAGRGREGGVAADDPAAAPVEAIAAAHGASPAQIRLAFTLAQGPHVLAIPGTGNVDHLDGNVAAAAIRLSEAERARLEAV